MSNSTSTSSSSGTRLNKTSTLLPVAGGGDSGDPDATIAIATYTVAAHQQSHQQHRRRRRPLVILFAHANGLCKEVWEPVIARLLPSLADRFAPIEAHAWDNFFSGDSAAHNLAAFGLLNTPTPSSSSAAAAVVDWDVLARHAAAVARWARERQPPGAAVLGVGHSIGGYSLIRSVQLAAQTSPVVDALALLEPVVTIPSPPTAARAAFESGLVTAAESRRGAFASRAEAAAAYRGKAFFASWTPEAFDLYIAHGFGDDVDSGGEPRGGVMLKCAPASEAAGFRGARTMRAYVPLDAVRCRVQLIAGGRSVMTLSRYGPRRLLREEVMVERMPNARFKLLPDVTHMMIADDPDLIARELVESTEWLLPEQPSDAPTSKI